MNNKFYTQLLEEITRQLEEGRIPWHKPWTWGPAYNAITEKRYRGLNSLNLAMISSSRGYSDPRWMTYKQAEAKGWQVENAKGMGVLVQYWKFEEVPETDEMGEQIINEDGLPVMRRKVGVFYAYVFNACHITGIPPLPKPELRIEEENEKAEQIIKNSNAKIEHIQSDKAAYSPGRDIIIMPKRAQFDSINSLTLELARSILNNDSNSTRHNWARYKESEESKATLLEAANDL